MLKHAVRFRSDIIIKAKYSHQYNFPACFKACQIKMQEIVACIRARIALLLMAF
jgi:hypothetical protein